MSSVVSVGPEVIVNATSAGDQIDPEVAVLADGRLAVVWGGNNSASENLVYLRLLNGDGSYASAEKVLAVNATAPEIAADDVSRGGVIGWQGSAAGGVTQVEFGLLSEAGDLRAPPVTLYSATYALLSGATVGLFDVAAHGGGGVVASSYTTLPRFGGGTETDTVAYASAAGTVSSVTTDFTNPAVASANAQNLVWVSGGGSAAADGPLSAGSFTFSGSPVAHYDLGVGRNTAIAALPAGHAVVAFESGGDIFFEILADGHASTATMANSLTTGLQYAPAVAALADGRFVIAWTDTSPGDGAWDVRARVFNANLTPATDEFQLGAMSAGVQADVSLAAGPYGGFAAAWQGLDADGSGIRAQAFELIDATQTGTAGADILRGSPGADSQVGGAGDDWLYGQGGFDVLAGGAGADKFIFTLDGSVDRVLDFNPAEGDNILLFDPVGRLPDGTQALLTWNLGTHALTWDPDSDAGAATPVTIGALYGTSAGFGAANLAAGFQPSALRVINPDFSRTETVFDWAGGQEWTRTVASFSSLSQLSEYDVYFDDGSVSNRWFDDAGSQAWWIRYAEFDPTGQLSTYVVWMDDGDQVFRRFDTDNSQPWVRTVEEYTGSGQLASSYALLDTGWSWLRTFDTDGSHPWAYAIDDYDPLGRLFAHHTYDNNGVMLS